MAIFDSGILPIGIDVGFDSVKVVQLRRRRGQLELLAAARVDLSPAARENPGVYAGEVEAALRRTLSGGTFKGKACVAALPAALVQTKSVRLPQMPDEEINQAVQWEAKDRFGFDLADAGFAYFKAGEVRRGTELRDEYLLFAAPADAVRARVDLIGGLGFELIGIDLQPCAVVRAVERGLSSPPGAATCVVDLGAGGTQVSVCQDGRLGFYKFIEIGGDRFDKAVAEKLGVPVVEALQIRQRAGQQSEEEGTAPAPLEQAVLDAMRPAAEELAHELDMCLRYYVVTFRCARPDVLTVVGGNSYSTPLLKTIAATLGVRVEQSNPMRGIVQTRDLVRADRSAEWAGAIGLSLYDTAYAALGEAPV